MRYKFLSVIIIIVSIVSIWGDNILPNRRNRPVLSIWNNIRYSAYTEENDIHLRYDSIDLPLIDSELFYRQNEQWQTAEINNLYDLTFEAVINADPALDLTCRLKTGSDSLTAMMPALIESDIFPPAVSELSYINDDMVGDTLVVSPECLDITGSYSGYDEDYLYTAIKNNGSGFPTDSGGFIPDEFYIYIAALANPETALEDTVVYGMVYSGIPLLFESGLYRIVGSQLSIDSFQLIGALDASIQDSVLIMRSSLSDLTNDDYFGEWPSITNALALDFMTVKFALPSEFGIVDFTMPSLQFMDKIVIPSGENHLPVLSDIVVNSIAAANTLSLNYTDQDANFPLIAEVVVDGADTYDLVPQSYEYNDVVEYQCVFNAVDWEHLLIRFSDNGYEFVEIDYYFSGITDLIPEKNIACQVYPNPFNPNTSILFMAGRNDEINADIYNNKGQHVVQLIKGLPIMAMQEYQCNWDGRNQENNLVSSGIYYLKISGNNTAITKKITLMK